MADVDLLPLPDPAVVDGYTPQPRDRWRYGDCFIEVVRLQERTAKVGGPTWTEVLVTSDSAWMKNDGSLDYFRHTLKYRDRDGNGWRMEPRPAERTCFADYDSAFAAAVRKADLLYRPVELRKVEEPYVLACDRWQIRIFTATDAVRGQVVTPGTPLTDVQRGLV